MLHVALKTFLFFQLFNYFPDFCCVFWRKQNNFNFRSLFFRLLIITNVYFLMTSYALYFPRRSTLREQRGSTINFENMPYRRADQFASHVTS